MRTAVIAPAIAFARRRWWAIALLLLALGGWLGRPSAPAHMLHDSHPVMAVSPDARLVATDRAIWDVRTGSIVRGLAGRGRAFSANGRFLVALRADEPRAEILHTSGRADPHSILLPPGPEPMSMAIDGSGALLAVARGGDRPSLTVYDARSGLVVATLPPGPGGAQLIFSPNDRYLLVGGADSTRVYVTGVWNQLYAGPGGGAIAYTGPGQRIAVAQGGTITVTPFNGEVARAPRSFPAPYGQIDTIAISPDGQLLAVVEGGLSGRSPFHMAIVRISDGALLQRYEGPRVQMRHVAFADDGSVITAGVAGAIARWQIAPPSPWPRRAAILAALLLLTDRAARAMVARWRAMWPGRARAQVAGVAWRTAGGRIIQIPPAATPHQAPSGQRAESPNSS